MARFLFVSHSALGHVSPLLTLARLLDQHRHCVSIYCDSAFASLILEHHYTFCAPRRWITNTPTNLGDVAMQSGVEDNPASIIMRHRFFGSVEAMTYDIMHYAKNHEVDGIVSDVLMPGAGLAAELLGLPWASFTVCPVPVLDTYRAILGDYFWSCFDNRTTRQQLGLPPKPGNLLEAISPFLHLVPATRQFVGTTLELPAQICCIGPLSDNDSRLPPPWIVELQRGPAPILVTVSSRRPTDFWRTEHDVRRYLRAAIDGLADLPVQVVMTTSSWQSGIDLGPLPSNVRLTAFTPHEALMPMLSVVITHGGWGVTGRALRHGLPLVFVPFGADQPLNAARCAELGFGLTLELREITPDALRATVRLILDDPAYRARAQEEAALIRRAYPRASTVAALEGLLDRVSLEQ